jgi:deazaflavin-dependent oxidoreductase (nitroreductase family)
VLQKLIMSPAGWAFDRFMVRWTGLSPLSAVFAHQNGIKNESRTLVLVVKGRKTGRKRSVALAYFEIDGHLLVVGSAGGSPVDPQWVTNLRANPDATIYVARKARRVTARISTGEERRGIWEKLAVEVPTYAHYQTQVAREIPLVILVHA